MKKTLATTLLAVAALGVPTAVLAQTAARVNGVAIPQARLDAIVKGNTPPGQPESPEVRNRLKDILINLELTTQEAVRSGLDKNPEIAQQLEVTRQQILQQAYLQEYIRKNPVSDADLKKEYDRVKAQTGDREYKARHILVDSEDEAKQIIAQLKKGGNFEKIAADKSKDTGSKARGGDLDWSPPGRYVPPFSQALTKLKKGQTTDVPVQTQFGWHVIRLDDERPTKFPSFEEAKPAIQQQLSQQVAQKAINDLRAKAKIE